MLAIGQSIPKRTYLGHALHRYESVFRYGFAEQVCRCGLCLAPVRPNLACWRAANECVGHQAPHHGLWLILALLQSCRDILCSLGRAGLGHSQKHLLCAHYFESHLMRITMGLTLALLRSKAVQIFSAYS